MAKVLVIHGAGMNMRGKVQTDIFGPMTLPEYDERIRGYAAELDLEVEIFHSNIEGEIVNKIYEANDKGFDAALFNPAAFGTGYPALVAAISQVQIPDDRGSYLEPDKTRSGFRNGAGQPWHRRGLRVDGILSGAARRARHAGGKEVINAAIVGLGRWGRTLVNSVQGKSSAIRFTAGHTRTRASAEAFCAENGIALKDDLDADPRRPGDRCGRLCDAAQPARRAGRANRRGRQARLHGKAVHARLKERQSRARRGGAGRGRAGLSPILDGFIRR